MSIWWSYGWSSNNSGETNNKVPNESFKYFPGKSTQDNPKSTILTIESHEAS